jgi:hypothetical protein
MGRATILPWRVLWVTGLCDQHSFNLILRGRPGMLMWWSPIDHCLLLPASSFCWVTRRILEHASNFTRTFPGRGCWSPWVPLWFVSDITASSSDWELFKVRGVISPHSSPFFRLLTTAAVSLRFGSVRSRVAWR